MNVQCTIHFFDRFSVNVKGTRTLYNRGSRFMLNMWTVAFGNSKNNLSYFKFLQQCSGATTFVGGSGSPRSRSRLRHRPNWVQAKKAAPAPYTNIFHFELFKSELLMQGFFCITFTVINCSEVMFCHNNKAFAFLFAKKMQPEPP